MTETGALSPWDLAVVALLIVCGALYLVGSVQLSRRGVRMRPLESVAFGIGWCALMAAVLPPLDALAVQLFSIHMVQHELMMLIGAPLRWWVGMDSCASKTPRRAPRQPPKLGLLRALANLLRRQHNVVPALTLDAAGAFQGPQRAIERLRRQADLGGDMRPRVRLLDHGRGAVRALL